VKIQLKRSDALNAGSAQPPSSEQMLYGELAVNYSSADPSLFIKDSNDNIIKLIGESSSTSYWENNGQGGIYPISSTTDVLIGGTNVANSNIVLKATGDAQFKGNVTIDKLANAEVIAVNSSGQLIASSVATPGNGALGIRTFGQNANATGTYTANQSSSSILTLPQIRYQDLSGTPTIPTVGNGSLSITTFGEGESAGGTFTANQSGASTLTLPQIRYQDLSGTPTIPTVGNGTITVVQPGTANQSFTVNQSGNTTITLKNDNTVPTVGNGALTLKTYGEERVAGGTFTANQSAGSTLTLPQIRYADLSGTPTIPTVGNGTITIKQPGTSDQSFTTNQAGNTVINLRNDNTVSTVGDGTITIRQPGKLDQSFTVNQTGDTLITLSGEGTEPGDGRLTIRSFGDAAPSTGTFTANQASGSTLTLPQIRYSDLSGTPTIPTVGNGTITIRQPGTTDQAFTVNQDGNTLISLKNDNTVPTVGDGTITIVQPGTLNQTFTVNQTGNTTITLKNDNTVPTVGNGQLLIRITGQTNSQTGSFTANQSGTGEITLPAIKYSGIEGTPTIPSAPGNGTIRIVQSGNVQSFTTNQSGDATITLLDTNTTYTGGTGIDIVGTDIRIDSSVARVNVNNTFTGRQVFDKQNVTGDIRFTAGATANFFDNSTSGRGSTSVINYNRVNIAGCVETTAGGAVLAFVNNQQIDMVGGTNTLNVFPSGFKSTPKAYTQWGNFAHFLCQSFAMGETDAVPATVNKVYGYHVCSAAMTGIQNNYGLSTAIPEDGNKNYAVYCSGTAPSFFNGDVTSNGTIGFSGRFSVRMDADSPSAYTTRTITEKDENLNDVQVTEEEYTGATEDLATMIKSVRSRLLAIESNSVSSESGNNTLFDLLTDLADRVTALESA